MALLNFWGFFLLVFLLVGAAMPITAQVSVSDTTVERMMGHSQYQEANDLLSARLKAVTTIDNDHKLYYNNRLSLAQLRLRNIGPAMQSARASLLLAKKSNDSTLVVDAWKVAAYAYNNSGKLDSALLFTRQMLLFGERNKDEKLTRNAIVSMATILSQNRRFDEALAYYQRANLLTIKLKDTINFSLGKFNLGLTFLNLIKTDSCIYYLLQAATLAQQNRQNDALIYIYGTMADCYLRMKNEKERKRYLLLANQIAEKIGNKQFLAMGFSNLAQGALELKSYNEVLGYGQRALDLLKEQPYPVLKMKVDSMMCSAWKETGNFSEAFNYLSVFVKEKEQISSERQQQQLNSLMVSLQVKEKDLTIAQQQLDLGRKKKNLQLMGLVVVIIVLLAMGQLLFIVRIRKFRKELFRKEKDLDQQMIEIQTWMEWKQNNAYIEKRSPVNILEKVEQTKERPSFNAQTSLYTALRELFNSQKLYLDPELNLNTVIRILSTNKKYLYQAISENSDENFRSFLNRYRVAEAKRIIGQKLLTTEELILSELYASVGFNSPATFYKAFKSVTGLSPQDYATELKAELKGNN
jgi:AraC-like DNA-binding protein